MIQHRGHDIVELDDKAQSARKMMQDGIERAQKFTEGWDAFVQKLDKGKASVNRELETALEKIESTKTEFNRKMIRLAEILEESTNKQISEVRATNEKSIRELSAYKKNINQKKCAIDKQIEKMKKKLKNNNDSQVIKLSQETIIELEKILLEAKGINEASVNIQTPAFRQPQFELRLVDFGTTSEEILSIGQPLKTPTRWGPLGFQFWQKSKIAVSGDGRVVIYGKMQNDMVALKCFNKKGKEIWVRDLPRDIEGNIGGICIIGQDLLLTANVKNNMLSLRNLADGTWVNNTLMPFTVHHLLCFNTERECFICNTTGNRIHKVHLAGEFIRMDDNISIPYTVQNLYGMCLAESVTKRKMFVLSSGVNSMIQAIDAENGRIIWEIKGEFGGKQIRPHGMCADDSGHIYVADGSNCRILQLRCTGEVQKCLFVTKHVVGDVKWLEKNKKLLVFHREGPIVAMTVYEI